MSRVHLHRRLKELTNQSPRDFIRNSRLRLSTKLLVETGLSVGDVASRVGFKNANNFTTHVADRIHRAEPRQPELTKKEGGKT